MAPRERRQAPACAAAGRVGVLPPARPLAEAERSMNPARWDAIAEAFERGEFVPANGWAAWNAQAVKEAVTIRRALPRNIDTLLEVGCGVGRLTPHLAVMFPSVVALDTSPACRRVTAKLCAHHANVIVTDALPTNSPAAAALVWGNLYDDDWPTGSIVGHREMLREAFPLVLEGNSEGWALSGRTPEGGKWIRLDKGKLELL